MEENAGVELPNTCAFVPEDNKKRMSPKWIALIVVGALFMVCSGGIILYYRSSNDLDNLNQKREDKYKNIYRLEQDSSEYEISSKRSAIAKKDFDNICDSLSIERKELRKLDERIASIKNQQIDKSVDSIRSDSNIQQRYHKGGVKKLWRKLFINKEKKRETKQDSHSQEEKDLKFVSYDR